MGRLIQTHSKPQLHSQNDLSIKKLSFSGFDDQMLMIKINWSIWVFVCVLFPWQNIKGAENSQDLLVYLLS